LAFQDPFKRTGSSRSELDALEQLYLTTRNPIHVWRCIQICTDFRDIGCEGFPEWVDQYLREVADSFQELYVRHSDKDVKNVAAEIAAALRVKAAGQGVRAHAFDHFDREDRNRRVAHEVVRYLREHPETSVIQACSHVSETRTEAAYRFRQAQAQGKIPQNRQPDDRETEISEDTVLRAYKEWADYLNVSTEPAKPSR